MTNNDIAPAAETTRVNELAQDMNTAKGDRYITPGMPEQLRKMASEGIVLLKNEGGVLPVKPDETVSVFGRVQHDWFFVGYGSGGDVHPPYTVSLFEGFENAGIKYNVKLKDIYDEWCERPENKPEENCRWAKWPFFHKEMPLDASVAEAAAKQSDIAVVIIGRAAGEDRENKLEAGSYYLTDTEKDMLAVVTKAFSKTVLIMDCGNIIDMSFVDDYKIDAILYAWQLGMENGNAVADVLCGKVNPSGKLSDTIAKTYENYPSSANFGKEEYNNYAEDIYVGYRYFTTFAKDGVKYPFGFGLSYTTFDMCASAEKQGENTVFTVKVTNTGKVSGKEVAEIYASAPDALLGKAKRSLAGYAKTKLLAPGESEILTVTVNEYDYASFDDSGVTGNKNCFVLEAGKYSFYLGGDSTTENKVFEYAEPETKVVRKCVEALIPQADKAFLLLNPVGDKQVSVSMDGKVLPASPIAQGSRDLRQRILDNLPAEIIPTGDKGIKLADVKSGKNTLEEFIAQLSDVDLINLTRGEGAMGSALGTEGNAGAFGGISESLRDKGVLPVITADGPAGLRVKRYTSLLPCGTAIACAWNDALAEETFTLVGKEAVHFALDVNLAPGLNIHRDPLCGRNFEYFAEDPMLSGRMAAAVVRGLQGGGVSACPKHFACNNQEFNRNYNDERVSMRALREIYLKNFEYCVKEGKPRHVMSSYNKINGVWNHYNYDLITTVLRGEWGFNGTIVTDWWMRRDTSPEFPNVKDNAYRTRAQVDVFMPGNWTFGEDEYKFDEDHLASLSLEDGLTRAELQRTAKNVLNFILMQKM